MVLTFTQTTYFKPPITRFNYPLIFQNTPSTWLSIAVCAAKILHHLVLISSFTASARFQVTALGYYSLASIKLASLRRSKTMPTDGATGKFLYTILKQLDLKSVCGQSMKVLFAC